MDCSVSGAAPLDLVGIGFGPSNLALAIALDELAATRGRRLGALFLERQSDYSWHGNTLVAQSELQISFLKDLVSLRNPTSVFSFVNYLHKHGRLVDFINLGTFYPCRMEFNDYLRWIASHFAHQCEYGENVLQIEPVQENGRIILLRICSRDATGREQIRHARSVVVSTGGTPRIPDVFDHLKDEPRVFHHAHYLKRMAAWTGTPGKPLRVAVIGGGQSAAEAFIDLNDGYPWVQVDLILRAAVLKPADDSPFVNEIFSPEYTDLMFNQPESERERLIREYHNTNYSVVDLDLIERIYRMFYHQKVSGDRRHRFLSRRTIEACEADGQGVDLTLRDLATAEIERRRYDVVILATGYERTSHHRLLAPLADYLGDFRVDRNYRVRAAAPCEAGVFIQGFCQSTHGLSDTLLSVLPIRAAEIANALYDLAPVPSADMRSYEARERALSDSSF